jgi:hypothetical protein
LDVIVVHEEFLSDRWIIIYRRRNGDLTILARYILFESWTSRDYKPLYAPIVDVGVSLDQDKCHIVVEQDRTQRCILIFDNGKPGGVQMEELAMWPIGIRRERDEGVEAIQERVAASALRRMPQVRGDIVDRRMVASIYSRKAYVLEQTATDKWLDVYVWLDASWLLRLSCRRTEQDEVGLPFLRAPIVDVFVQNSLSSVAIVVEENEELRWWHTYEWNGSVWRYKSSNEALLKNVVVLGAVAICNGNGESEAHQLAVKEEEVEGNAFGKIVGSSGCKADVIDLSMDE